MISSGRTWRQGLPCVLLMAAAALVAMGLIGIARSEELAGSSNRFFRQQLVWCVLSLAALSAAAFSNYRLLCRWSYCLFGLTLVMLLAVYLFPPINGAQRWLRFGLLNLQPSELAKVVFVLVLARLLMYGENQRTFWGLLLPLGVAVLPMLLILREPDLGTALVFLPVLFLMLLSAGARKRDLAALVVAGIAVAPLLWSQMSLEQRSRVTAMLQQSGPGERPTGDGYHLHQAKQLLAMGGWSGSLWHDDAIEDIAAFRVPEAHTDSIFSVLGERLGILGLTLLLGLYLLLAQRGLAIAAGTEEPFGRLVAVGLTSLILVQALINMGMMVGLLPITGLALPLVSYGGSSMLANSIALGLLVNISLRRGYEIANTPFRFHESPAGRRTANQPRAVQRTVMSA